MRRTRSCTPAPSRALEERQRTLAALEEAVTKETEIFRANNARRREHLDELEVAALEMLQFARDNLENSRKLYQKRVIARISMERNQQELNQAHRTLLDLSRDRDILEANEIKRENDSAARIREMKGSGPGRAESGERARDPRGGGNGPGTGLGPGCSRSRRRRAR